MIALAASRAGDGAFVYLEGVEENTPRNSFDINLYRAGLRLTEIHPLLSRMRHHFSIPIERFDRLYKEVGDKRLGHLSGGVSRAGTDYLTVYYEA